MKKCLVFLTKTFPFGTGEEFIENELPVLAREFDKIILIATSAADGAEKTRRVTKNTEVYAIPASAVSRAVKAAAVRNCFVCPAEFREERRTDGAVGVPLRRLYFSYFLAKGTTVAEKAAAILAKTDVGSYDAITFYSYWFYDTAFAALQLKRNCRAAHTAVFSRAHGYDLYPERNPSGYLPLRPYLLKNLDGVFPCSEHGCHYLKKTYPAFRDKVTTAYLGTSDFGVGPTGGSPFRIVSCCHLVPLKRVDLLAKALALLAEDGLALEWTHFGGGPGLEELKAYASSSLGFMKYSFPGEVRNGKLMQFYRETPVDLFVNTSSSEGLPVSIMEACSFGIPILATNVGGTGETVKNGLNGFLLPADVTPELLAGKIREICRMPADKQSSLHASSRKIWENGFNAAANYAAFAKAISPADLNFNGETPVSPRA